MEFLKKYKKAFITAITVLCLAVMTITTMYQINPVLIGGILGYVFTPVQSVFTKSGGWVYDKIDFFVRMSEIEKENEQLRQENEELLADSTRLRSVEKEYEKLLGLLEVDDKYADYPKLVADISAKDPGNWYNAYLINKGTNNGVKKNMIVLSAGGLAGRVTEAWQTSAKVVSLIDDTSSVSAKNQRTGDTGFVRGDAILMMEGKCLMDRIEADADIEPGDVIVTGQVVVTGQVESIYPPGILIGEVLEVLNDPNGTKTAIIKPAVDFRRMESVLVVTQRFGHDLDEGEGEGND